MICKLAELAGAISFAVYIVGLNPYTAAGCVGQVVAFTFAVMMVLYFVEELGIPVGAEP